MRAIDSLEGTMKRALGTLIGTGILLAATAASAQQYGGGYSGSYSTGSYRPEMPSYPSGIDNIGNAGQFTIAIERITGVASDHETYVDPLDPTKKKTTAKTTQLALLGNDGGSPSVTPRAAFDYFIIDGLSLGGSISYMSHALSGGPTEKLFMISPRVGYAYAFDNTFSLWGRAAFDYSHLGYSVPTVNASGGPTTTNISKNLTQLTLEAMLGISPMKHVAFLVGPYVDIGLGGSRSEKDPLDNTNKSASDKLTSFGLTAAILAYY